jgi:glutathione synthase
VSLRVAFQMDPIESVNFDTDSSLMMALEAVARGHSLWHYHPRDMALRGHRLHARARKLTVRAVRGDHYTLGPVEDLDLSTLDVIMMRQDPPFDMAYITATHMLDHIHPKVLVVNDPTEVRNAPEKLFVTHFPDLMPPTVITASRDEVLAARREWQDIIIKPLYGNGGSGVFHIRPDDENLGALLETFTQLYREPIIVQKYLPEIRQGDKRIILIDGEPAGAVSRLPQAGEARANFHAGGTAAGTRLTPREQQICATIGPVLRQKGLIFVGIDVIGDYMTEINVTSPTGIQEINRLDGSCLQATLWDAVERRFVESRR